MNGSENKGELPRPMTHNGGGAPISAEQKAIVDYAVAAVAAVNAAQTEEIVTRTKHSVHTEINAAFETYTKLSLSRKIWMALGAAVAFGGGFLVKGWLKPKALPAPNGVNTDDALASSARKY